MTTTDLDTSITVAADGVVSALLRSTSRQWAEAAISNAPSSTPRTAAEPHSASQDCAPRPPSPLA